MIPILVLIFLYPKVFVIIFIFFPAWLPFLDILMRDDQYEEEKTELRYRKAWKNDFL